MSRLRKLSVAVMALFTSVQAVSAPISYRLIDNESNRECGAVLTALKRAQLAAKSDKQICDVMNSPVTDLLRGKDFRDIEWVSAPAMTKSEKEVIAKRIYESGIETGRLSFFAKNESEDMVTINNILSKDNVAVEYADLKYGYRTVYVMQMRRTQCDADYKIDGGIPIWGFFADKSRVKGLPSNQNSPAGNLFYFGGRLLTFSITPDYWYPESHRSNKKTELSVAIWSMDENVSASGDVSFSSQLVCDISIHR